MGFERHHALGSFGGSLLASRIWGSAARRGESAGQSEASELARRFFVCGGGFRASALRGCGYRPRADVYHGHLARSVSQIEAQRSCGLTAVERDTGEFLAFGDLVKELLQVAMERLGLLNRGRQRVRIGQIGVM